MIYRPHVDFDGLLHFVWILQQTYRAQFYKMRQCTCQHSSTSLPWCPSHYIYKPAFKVQIFSLHYQQRQQTPTFFDLRPQFWTVIWISHCNDDCTHIIPTCDKIIAGKNIYSLIFLCKLCEHRNHLYVIRQFFRILFTQWAVWMMWKAGVSDLRELQVCKRHMDSIPIANRYGEEWMREGGRGWWKWTSNVRSGDKCNLHLNRTTN